MTMKTRRSKPMGCSKSSSKREVYSNTSLPQETWKISNKQSNVTPKGTRERRTNKKSEREIKETISLTITAKRIKYLGINLPKEVKDLYSENYKTLLKEIKDDIGEIYHVFGLEESTLWKWLYYPKQSTDSMQSLSNYHRHSSQN